jgi:hypothetical protein
MSQTTQKTLLFFIGAVTFAMLLAFGLARINRSKGLPFGILANIEGRVEVKSANKGPWLPPVDEDQIISGSMIRIGSNGTATLKFEGISVKLGPDCEVTTHSEISKNRRTSRWIHLKSGEIRVLSGDTSDEFYVQTDYGRTAINKSSDVIISHPAGQTFATVLVISGSTLMSDTSDSKTRPRQVSPTDGTILINSKSADALWPTHPAFNATFGSKEGHEAVTFSWGGRSDQLKADLLIRNLTTGELTTKDSAEPGVDITLPSGRYSWFLSSRGLVTAPRGFAITGSTAADDLPKTSTATTLAPPPPESPIVPAARDPVPDTAPVAAKPTDSSPSSSTAPTPGLNLNLKLLAPLKNAEIAVNDMAEQRAIWRANGVATAYELNIIGSAGNPSLHFKLEGHRTRQKLALLPPGRYSVQLRAGVGDGEFTPWVESFFDVVQTEVGQLAPTDVTLNTNPDRAPGQILVTWKKSAAPIYQVRVQSPGEPALIKRVKRSKILIPAVKRGQALLSVCALDAQGHIRGCAPEVVLPAPTPLR